MDILLLKFVIDAIDIAKYILNIYMWVIIIKVLLSWVNPDPYNPIVRFINDITEPVLNKVRLILPIGSSFAFDFSPIIIILIIIASIQLLNFIEYRYIMQNVPFMILRR